VIVVGVVVVDIVVVIVVVVVMVVSMVFVVVVVVSRSLILAVIAAATDVAFKITCAWSGLGRVGLWLERGEGGSYFKGGMPTFIRFFESSSLDDIAKFVIRVPQDLDFLAVCSHDRSAAALRARDLHGKHFTISDRTSDDGIWELLGLVLSLKPCGLLTVSPPHITWGRDPESVFMRTKPNFEGDVLNRCVRDANILNAVMSLITCIGVIRGVFLVFDQPGSSRFFLTRFVGLVTSGPKLIWMAELVDQVCGGGVTPTSDFKKTR
jgi:hypothetical protein